MASLHPLRIVLPSCALFIVLLLVTPPSAVAGPVAANATRDFASAYDCQWVTKCLDADQQTSSSVVCQRPLEPKYECVLRPGVDVSRPPCLVGYHVDEKNKCVRIVQ